MHASRALANDPQIAPVVVLAPGIVVTVVHPIGDVAADDLAYALGHPFPPRIGVAARKLGGYPRRSRPPPRCRRPCNCASARPSRHRAARRFSAARWQLRGLRRQLSRDRHGLARRCSAGAASRNVHQVGMDRRPGRSILVGIKAGRDGQFARVLDTGRTVACCSPEIASHVAAGRRSPLRFTRRERARAQTTARHTNPVLSLVLRAIGPSCLSGGGFALPPAIPVVRPLARPL
jgi:hypothetical protein